MENIIKREMWTTPIWVADTGFDKYFNDLLLMELRQERENGRFDVYNIWNVKSERLQTVREKLLELIRHEMFDYLNENHPAGYDPRLSNGWLNYFNTGEGLSLHDHAGSLLAATYYVNVPENSGDIYFNDPRGAIDWDWRSDGKVKYTSKLIRIKPKAGQIIMFPAFLFHGVEENKSNKPRITVTTNISNGDIKNPPQELINKLYDNL
jgi:uncharacterized protein (TIGR02466 family)